MVGSVRAGTVGRVTRRWGWLALAGVAGSLFVVTAVGGAWFAGVALSDGRVLGALGSIVTIGFGLLFWKWITQGAWHRANPPVDPVTGRPGVPSEPIGPWGVVGRVLMVLIVGTIVVGGVWSVVAERRSTDAAEGIRDQAERTVRRRGITPRRVEQARVDHAAWAIGPSGTSDPYDELLTVAGADVLDVSVRDGGAAILLRPDAGPPCVVVSIDGNAVVRSRLLDRCSVIRTSG